VRILVVDDNRSSADAWGRTLTKRGDQVEVTYDGASAIRMIESHPPDVVLTDLRMEPVDGLEVLRAARAQRPPVEVIVFTAYGAVETAVEALHLGARDFLTKPVTLEQLVRRLEDLDGTSTPALPPRTETATTPNLAAPPSAPNPVSAPAPAPASGPTALLEEPFLAHARASQDLVQKLQQIAEVPSPVWLRGEIGSGREHAAVTLHRLRRNPGPLTVLDLVRDEAFPAAGTVVLPNLDTLPLDLQRQLARRLPPSHAQVRLVTTVGNTAPAGGDLRAQLQDGRFDQELYFRLCVLEVDVPPLRERQEDILPLLERALERYAERYGRPRPHVPAEYRERLWSHTWPGNIRELHNLAERAIVLGPDALRLEAARPATPGMPTLEVGFNLSDHLEKIERRILVEALRKCNDDRNAACRILGLERNTLRYKLMKYKIIER
jgi:DNA-binding NtrC family response regulator